MVVRFGRADVGRRVTLRRTLEDAATSGASLGDVVGVLEAWQDGVLTLRRRNGELVEVAESTIVAGRVVAPEISAAELDGYADDTWPADEQERLGDWRLRHHHGVTHRPNSALATGDPGLPFADALAAVTGWYSARGATPALMTPVPSAVADACAALGWHQERETLVLAGALTEVLEAARAQMPAVDGLHGAPDDLRDLDAPDDPGAPDAPADLDGLDGPDGPDDLRDLRVVVTTDLPADWDLVLPGLADPARAGALSALMTGAPVAAFATLRDADGAPVAVARAAITRGWANLTNIEVLEHARGRRLAVAVVAALAAWALEQRATHAYLQMWPDNAAALQLYGRLGLSEHHRYAYATPPRTPRSPN